MGFMTVTVVRNDEAHDIKRGGEAFVDGLYRALCSGEGAALEGTVVHPSDHADYAQLILVAGGTSEKVFTDHAAVNPKTREGQADILRAWAQELGFDLVERRWQ